MRDEMTAPCASHHQSQSCVALTLYLGNLAPSGRRSMRSLLQQVALLNNWAGSLETLPWLTLRYQQVATIRLALRQANKSPNTINTTLAAIRGVLKAGFLLGQFPALEWQRIQAIASVNGQQNSAGRHLRGAEINRLFKACRQDESIVGVRDAAVLALLVYAGLRRSEVESLNVVDYCRRTGQLVIREGKGQRHRELRLPADARQMLRQWLQCRGNTPGPLMCHLFKNGTPNIGVRLTAMRIYRILKQRSRKAGIAECSPHDLRRTFVTRLLEQGVDFNTTRLLAGHEQIQTTTLYDRRPDKAQRQAMANFRF